MTKIIDAPLRSSVPSGGYVIVTEPVAAGSPLSTFAKVLPTALGSGANVRDYGAVGDGVTDDTAAFNAAIAQALTSAYGSRVRVPSGRYILSATLTIALTSNQSLTIEGDGATSSELFWTSDTNGIAVTLAASAWLRDATYQGNYFGIKGVSLVRAVNSEGKLALSITGTATANPGGRQVDLADVIIRGTPNLATWKDGLALTNVTGVFIDRAYLHNSHTGPQPGTGTAIAVAASGTYIVTEIHIENSIIYAFANGLTLNGHIEGVTVSDTDFVACLIGISGNGAPDNISDGLSLTGVHIDARNFGVQLTAFNTLQAIGVYFLGNDATASNTYTCIDLTESARHTIIGCHCFGRLSAPSQVFARITNTTAKDALCSAIIANNSCQGMSGPFVVLASSTAHAIVSGNKAHDSAAPTDARGLSAIYGNSIAALPVSWDNIAVTKALSVSAAINVTAAGTNQATATPITTQFVQIGTAAAGTGIVLPNTNSFPAGFATRIDLWNASGGACLVYPGVSNSIVGGGGLNLPISLAPGTRASLWYMGSGTVWSPSESSTYLPLAGGTVTGATTIKDLTLSTDASQGAFSGAWSVSNPTPTPAAGTFTTAAATVRYKKIGRMVSATVTVAITAVGTATGVVTVPMPFAAGAGAGMLMGREISVVGRSLAGAIGGGSANMIIYPYDNSSVIVGNGYNLILSGVYEAGA
jgi:hypothetical protein